MEIVDTIHIKWLQNFETQADISNAIDIDNEMARSRISQIDIRAGGYSYLFIIDSLLFRVSITNNAKTIFITCNGLSNTKTTILHDKDYETLGVVTRSPTWVQLKDRLIS